MNLIDILEKLESTPKGNARLEALKTLDCGELRDCLRMAMDPMLVFGVKKIPKTVDVAATARYSDSDWWQNLEPLLQSWLVKKLSTKNLKAFTAVHIGKCTQIQRKWSERIIKKDLRLNLEAKTVNKVFPKLIFHFEIPLAERTTNKANEITVTNEDMLGRWCFQPKHDGGRTVVFLPKDGGEVKFLSRTGHEWVTFESLRKLLSQINKEIPRCKDFYLDTEVVSVVNGRVDFQAIQKTMRRGDGIEIGDLQMFIFDCAEAEEWEAPSQPYLKRLQQAQTLYGFLGIPAKTRQEFLRRIHVIENEVRENPTIQDCLEACDSWCAKSAEGLMTRMADEPVVMKRSDRLLKWKNWLDCEGEIIGFEEGQGKAAGTLGALWCRLPKTNKEFKTGSGFSDEDRRVFWEQRQEFLGQYASVKFKLYTEAGIPREPIFRGIRSKNDV